VESAQVPARARGVAWAMVRVRVVVLALVRASAEAVEHMLPVEKRAC